MHGFVLSLEREDVLGALSPGLPICRVDVSKNMRDSILEVLDCVGIGVEIASTIPLSVEVSITLEGVVAVDRDHKLNAVVVGFDHKLVETVEDGVIPSRRRITLKRREGIDYCTLLG